MYKNKRILALIPARAGSKGLPGKNIRLLLDRPLIAWTIKHALGCKYIDRVIVSTDNLKIAKTAKNFGAEVPFLRPKRLAADKTKAADVILHALAYFKKQDTYFDYLVYLEPTSPLREIEDVTTAIEMLANNKAGAVSIVGVSKVEATHPVFDVIINEKGLIRPYVGNFLKTGRRQDLSELYFLEGSLYISEVKEFIKNRSFYHDKTLPYIVPRWKSLEVDTYGDLICAAATLKNMKKIKKMPS